MNDMISRQKAINYIEDNKDIFGGDWNPIVRFFVKVLESVPSVRPVGEDAISRQALIDEILEDGNGAVLSYTMGMDEDELVERIEKQMIQYFIGVVEHASPVEPKRTGEWIPKKYDYPWYHPECSVCGYKEKHEPRNYCPDCGAQMTKKDSALIVEQG